MELKNSIFLDLVLLSCTPVAINSFSCPSLRSSYTATLSSTCFWILLPSGIQSGEETDVGRHRLNRALESLFTFTLLVFRTKQDTWHKRTNTTEEGFSLSFHNNCKLGLTYPRLAIFSLRELNRTSPLVCFEGWNKFSLPIWSPWEPKLSHRRRGYQLGLLSINFVF